MAEEAVEVGSNESRLLQVAGLPQIHLLALPPAALVPEKLCQLMVWMNLGLSDVALPELDQMSSSGLVAGNHAGWTPFDQKPQSRQR